MSLVSSFSVHPDSIVTPDEPLVSYALVVPCFLYIILWAIYIRNKDGRVFTASGNRRVQREVEASMGGVVPATAVGLSHTGEQTE